MNRLALAAFFALAPLAAFASVGKVQKLEGSATRTPEGGKAEALQVGSELQLKDTLEVQPRGMLRLELTDGSVIALDEKSKLVINEAEFEGQERKGFSAFLGAGKLWTTVKKALGGAKYEVTTQRAVAGVRGTIFRIDADALVKAAGKGRRADVVRVVEGVVRVNPSKEVAEKSKAAAKAAPKGPRTQVAGPTEITADAWELKFVELQKNSQIAVGIDLWEQAEIDQAAMSDKFQKWVNQGP